MEKKLSGEAREFYPDYLSEILIVIIVTLGAVFVLAMLFAPTLGREINFVSAYQPKPEWYFLWLYELIRYFPGKLSVFGAVVIPLFAVALMMFIPFIDKGTVSSRRKATVSLPLLLISIAMLTLIAVLQP